MPLESLASADLELVDLFGNGLPDLVQIERRRPVLAQPRRRSLRRTGGDARGACAGPAGRSRRAARRPQR